MESERKRRKYSTSSIDSDTTDSPVTSWSQSKNSGTSSTWVRLQHKKPSEVFRTDLITAMKLPDSSQLGPEDFYILSDPWRQEWEKGVQVPANLEAIPQPLVRLIPEQTSCGLSRPYPNADSDQASRGTGLAPLSRLYSCYDLDDLDVAWLNIVNQEFRQMALPVLDEPTLELALLELESLCEQKMQAAIEAEEGLGIEYDEDVVCDVCRSPEGEDGNEMVFCDKCNVCVHQACYGILKVPQGNWLCRTCALGVQPKCLLCPKRGGALKPTRSGTKWVHVSCALWIPEVSIGCPEKMEPITKVSHIPSSRWALSCSLCREHTGTCIQCSMPSCIVAFHVTCAFDHGLEMRTILAENDEVRFKSFCLEHSSSSSGQASTHSLSAVNGTHSGPLTSASNGLNHQTNPLHTSTACAEPEQRAAERAELEREKVSQRKQKLQELEDEFYQLVDPKEVSESLHLPLAQVDFIYQFWKLKRKANFNRPLVTLNRDEVDNLAQQEQDVLYRRLKLFTHLRQDLERVRNLCYMVTRRERMKHSLCDLQEKIFHLQIQLLEEELAQENSHKGEKKKQTVVKERGKERRKSSPDKKKERWKSENGSLLKDIGLSKSFPLENSLFDSWLAQSVQITADHMLSQWALGGQHRDKSTTLLSDQLLQGEESLLNLMMETSAWKTPQIGRKPRGSDHHHKPPRPSSLSSPTHTPLSSAGTSPSTGPSSLWSISVPADDKPKPKKSSSRPHNVQPHHPHHHQKSRRSNPSPQPPVSKMDSCHISEERGPWDSVHCGFTSSPSPIRMRLSRQGKSKSRNHHDSHHSSNASMDSNTKLPKNDSSVLDDADGYYSDGEQSETDMRSGARKLRLLHSTNEEMLRRSVLAS